MVLFLRILQGFLFEVPDGRPEFSALFRPDGILLGNLISQAPNGRGHNVLVQMLLRQHRTGRTAVRIGAVIFMQQLFMAAYHMIGNGLNIPV